MHDLTDCDNNRFGIRPFPRVALYPTSWNGEMTFEQISEDIRPRAAKMLLRQYRVWAQDLDDCLQNVYFLLASTVIAAVDIVPLVSLLPTIF